MMRIYFKTILLVILFVTVWDAAGQVLPDGPYFGQTPPGMTAEVFGPNIVSLPNRRELKPAFSPDGNECFIATVIDSAFTLLYTKQEDGHWLDPVPADFLGVTETHEPSISPDGQKLFFAKKTGPNVDIYVSTKVGSQWSAASALPATVNTSKAEWHPSTTSDGTLYFCTDQYIYRSELVDDQYAQAEKLDSTINTSYGAADPYIAPDESYLIFATKSRDFYISYRREDGTWSNPRELSIINTSGIEYCSYITYDNKYCFFSRPDGWGPEVESDIYWIDARAILPAYDFIRDGNIDFEDLEMLTANWLTGEPLVDIAPPETPDGIVNFLDFAALAENWMYTPPDIFPPAAPTGLTAAAGDATVSLDWDNDNDPDFDSYNVYRSTTWDNYVKLNVSPVTDSSYTDNTVINETAYFYVVTAVDTSDNESAYSDLVSAIPLGAGNIIIQEYNTGFCGIYPYGSIPRIYKGYTGNGFCNTMDTVGTGIKWSISVPSAGVYTLTWRHSNGSTDSPAKLLVDDVAEVPSISFPNTGGWENWTLVSQEVTLSDGIRNIKLESLTTNGLACIDYIMVTGDDPVPASCP